MPIPLKSDRFALCGENRGYAPLTRRACEEVLEDLVTQYREIQ
jgi:hypothetical protein